MSVVPATIRLIRLGWMIADLLLRLIRFITVVGDFQVTTSAAKVLRILLNVSVRP